MTTAMEEDAAPLPHQQGGEDEEEQLLFELSDVELTYGGRANAEGTGTLRVTSKRVAWAGAAGQEGFEVEVPCVTLHAISKDPASFPRPCLYCQITEGDEEGEDEEGAGGMEVYFAPQDPESLPALFEAMSKAALLNPDPPEPGEEEGDDELIYDQAGLDLAGCTAEQAAMLGRLDSLMQFAPGLGAAAGGGMGLAAQGQFDDAEEVEGGAGEGVNGHNGVAGEDEVESPQ